MILGSAGGFDKLALSVRSSACNLFFAGLVDYFFLIFCVKLVVSKYRKVSKSFIALRKILAILGVNRAFLGSKSTILNFSLNLLIRFFRPDDRH